MANESSSKKKASTRREMPDFFDMWVFIDEGGNVLGGTKKKDLVLDFIEANPSARHVKTKLYNKLPS